MGLSCCDTPSSSRVRIAANALVLLLLLSLLSLCLPRCSPPPLTTMLYQHTPSVICPRSLHDAFSFLPRLPSFAAAWPRSLVYLDFIYLFILFSIYLQFLRSFKSGMPPLSLSCLVFFASPHPTLAALHGSNVTLASPELSTVCLSSSGRSVLSARYRSPSPMSIQRHLNTRCLCVFSCTRAFTQSLSIRAGRHKMPQERKNNSHHH